MNAIHIYRIARKIYFYRIPFFPKLLYFLMYLLYNCSIPYTAEIGKGTIFGYGAMGIVIHQRAKIGDNCVIAQQVTIGGDGGYPKPILPAGPGRSGLPIIGNNVFIGAGAKIIGDVILGDNCVVGANAVVTRDIPENAIAVGIPAKVIKYRTDINTETA